MQQGRRSLREKLRTKGKKKKKSLKRILRWRVFEELMLLNWSLLVCTNIPSKSRSRPLLPAYYTSFPCALYLKRPLLPPHSRHGKERQFDNLFPKTALRGPTIPSKVLETNIKRHKTAFQTVDRNKEDASDSSGRSSNCCCCCNRKPKIKEGEGERG